MAEKLKVVIFALAIAICNLWYVERNNEGCSRSRGEEKQGSGEKAISRQRKEKDSSPRAKRKRRWFYVILSFIVPFTNSCLHCVFFQNLTFYNFPKHMVYFVFRFFNGYGKSNNHEQFTSEYIHRFVVNKSMRCWVWNTIVEIIIQIITKETRKMFK